MAIPQDLKFNPSEPDKNNEFIFLEISPLKTGTPYKFQFQWIFEDQKLNELVGDNWSATYDYLSKSAVTPNGVSNLTATWRDDSNNKTQNLYVRFQHDNSINNGTNNNSGVNRYRIDLYYDKNGPQQIFKTFYLTDFVKTDINKKWILYADENAQLFNFKSQFTVEVTPEDQLNRVNGPTVSVLSAVYENILNPPDITATAGFGSYSVTWSNAEADPNLGWKGLIHIEENTGSGWVGVASGNTKPIVITTSGANAYLQRSVRARFSDGKSNFTAYGNTVTVTPKTPDPTDETAPGVPTVTFVSSTSTTITVNIVNADTSTKAHRLRFKENGATLYQTDIVPYTAATTPYTFGNLKPNTTYNISAASYDNLNNLSAFSTPDINGTTQALVANPPTGVTLSATASGVLASWTAPAVQPARVDRYKIELWQDLATDVLITTEFAFSTNISFGGLAAGTYYIKVQTQDMYGTLSNPPTQSSSVAVTGTSPTDGLVPLSSPAAIVSPLYGALEVKWTGLTLGARSTTANPDPVTYEVHVSTTNNFTPSSSTLALQVDGTFAILKTLPPLPTPPALPTPLAYGTLYYVKILAKDADGPAASYGTQGSGTPSAIDNGDIAANAIRANVIKANEITANQINAAGLLANNIITVGARVAVVTAASVSGGNITYTTSGTHGFGNATLVSVTGMSTAAFNITNFAIQSTTTNTFVVLVGGSGATGSLSNQAGVATSTVNSAIKIDASGTGLSASPFKFYSGAGTYADAGTSPGTPFYLDTNGKFSLRDKLYFDGSTLTVNGTINAAAGNFSGAMTVNNGTMKIGTLAGGTAGTDGIYINTNNYWYSNGNIKIGGASNNVTWDGTTFKVTGEINAASGTITGNLTMTGGGSVIARTAANTLNYVTLSYAGLFAYSPNAGGTASVETTRIVSNAAAGVATLVTRAAKLGDTPGWTVDSTSIYSNTATYGIKLDSTSPGTITARNVDYYVGIKPRVSADSDIVLWAGQSSDGTGASFRVNSLGTMTANNAILTGTLKITPFASGSVMAFGNSVGPSSNKIGLYIGNVISVINPDGDYIYNDATFSLGGGQIRGTTDTLTIDFAKYGNYALPANASKGIFFKDMPGNDDDSWAGDPTVTVRDTDNKLVKGRRFIYIGSLSGNSQPIVYNYNDTTREGEIFDSDGVSRKVKIGDIVMVRE